MVFDLKQRLIIELFSNNDTWSSYSPKLVTQLKLSFFIFSFLEATISDMKMLSPTVKGVSLDIRLDNPPQKISFRLVNRAWDGEFHPNLHFLTHQVWAILQATQVN